MKKMFGTLAVLAFLVGCGCQEKDVNENVAISTEGEVIYDCQGEKIGAVFNNSNDPSTVELSFVDRGSDLDPVVLTNVEAASGAKYVSGNVVFWTHQDEAMLSMDDTGKSLNCTVLSDTVAESGGATDENGNMITPADCQMWFDGCNTCRAGEEGMPMACTRKACAPEMMQPAKCLDDDIIAECEAAGGVWSEEHDSCFEDPSTMASPGEK